MANPRDAGEFDRASISTNYTEFTVKKKADALLTLERFGLILLYVSIVVVIFWLASWYLGCLAFLAAAIAWWFTWPYVNIEYEYVTASGDWEFTIIYGGRYRKKLFSKKIKSMEIIAPYTSEYNAKYTDVVKHDFRKSADQTEDVYFAVYEEEGKKHMILFQCTNKFLKICQSYNRANTVAVDTLHY